MKNLLTSVAILLPVMFGSGYADAADTSRARYIVHLESPAAAVFEGFGSDAPAAKRALAPTHAATAGKARFDAAALEVKAYRAFIAGEQEDFEARASKTLGRALKPELKLDLVLNAVVLELSPEEAYTLGALPGVSRVEPDFVHTPQTDAAPAWVNAPLVWSGGVGAPTRGAGVVIGVIDTGINAGHPSFAGIGPIDGHQHTATRNLVGSLCASPTSPPCNGKLIGVRDFSTGTSSQEPNDGLDVDGHGSHVAATAAGNVVQVEIEVAGQRVPRELSGVAPHASIVSYKACEREADCLGSWLLAAINSAVSDGVDVINYSIGGNPRDPWADSSALALLAAREAGIVPVVAAGNSGPALGSVSSPGNAPWVISVANASHNRSVGSRLINFSGGSAPAPEGGSLLGASGTGGFGPARVVIPDDFPGCGIGTGAGFDAGGQPDGSSSPWAGNTQRFNGEIVICLRGNQARLAKSDNVRRAGAGGMILVNTIGDGEGVVADSHSLPATHLGFRAGELLKQWLAGGGERAQIEGARLIEDPSLADRLAGSSGRGPVAYGGVMLPSLAAPGTGILAAAGSGSGIVSLSGTSMAAPHIAGAAALLRALKPQWRVEQIQSALMLSARSSVRREDAVRPARRIDAGAGALDIAAAARIGLLLEETGSGFRNARPSLGGQPRALNLPGLMHERCFETCSLSRTVRDASGGGRWRASVDLPGGQASVSPAEFTLAVGASQRLDLAIDLRQGAEIGGWLDGQVRLTRVDGPSGAAPIALPLAVFADPGTLPQQLSFDVTTDSGFVDIPLQGLAALADLSVDAGALSMPVFEQRIIGSSPAPGSPYERIGEGSYFVTFSVPAASAAAPRRLQLVADASGPSSIDLGLYAGIDYSSDGRPNRSEQVCAGTGSSASKRCVVEVVQTGSAQTVWVLVHKVAGSLGGDSVSLSAALLDPQRATDRAAVATAPTQLTARTAFPLRLSWNDPGFLPGERRSLLLSLRARPGVEPFARIPVQLRHVGTEPAARLLEFDAPLRLRLPAGGRHERLFAQVPRGAGELQVHMSGNAQALLSLAPATSASLQVSGTPLLGPPSAAVSGDPALARVSGAALSEGRWHLLLNNPGSAAVDLQLTASLASSGAQAARPRFGSWYNPERSGSGLFLFAVGTSWGVVWYTYLEDGTPTWYIGAALAPASAVSVWSFPLSRMGWNGSVSQGAEVGRATLSFSDAQALQFGFEVDGRTGSEPLSWIGGQGCPRTSSGVLDLNGLWFDAGNSGFGYSLDASPELESIGQFLYDGRGVARWVFASGQPFSGAPLQVRQFGGACPLCEYRAPQSQVVGSLQVSYAAGGASQAASSLQFAAPLSGSWSRNHSMTRLSDRVGCSP